MNLSFQQSLEFWFNKLRTSKSVKASWLKSSDEEWESIKFNLPLEEQKRFDQVTKSKALNEFVVGLSIWTTLLYRYKMEEQVIAVSSLNIAGKLTNQNQKMFFDIANLKGQSFKTILGNIKTQLKTVIAHQDYEYQHLTEKLKANNVETAYLNDFSFGHLDLQSKDEILNSATIALVMDTNGAFFLYYRKNSFTASFAKGMTESYQALLSIALENAETPLDTTVLVEPDTVVVKEFSGIQTLHGLLTQRVEECPNIIGVIDQEEEYTYTEINEMVDRMVGLLIENGTKPGDIVALMMDRSVEMIVSIFATLKLGGTFLPLDPTYPQQRVEYIIGDAQPSILLTNTEAGIRADESVNIKVLTVSKDLILSSDPCTDHFENESNLAYIIYTSGTTGAPKGVMVEHDQVLNTLYAMEKVFPTENKNAYLFKTNYVFDVSLVEIFSWVVSANAMVILPSGLEKDASAITNYIEKYTISHLNFVPSMFSTFLDVITEKGLQTISKLTYILLAGEAISIKLANKIYQLNLIEKTHNLYGPTEASIYTTHFPLSNYVLGEVVPIGKAIENIEVYILDENKNIVPDGIAGELAIFGKGVASGYFNKPTLTAEKFITVSWSNSPLYLSGDIAKKMPNGDVMFLGRKDEQVKVRGYRIELNEIKETLLKYEGIGDVAVVVKQDANDELDKILCAYYTAKDEIGTTELIEHIGSYVPSYMIPDKIIRLESMPLNKNGKTDKSFLVNLAEENSYQEFSEEVDCTSTEIALRSLWEIVLQKKNIRTTDSFFDIGGHSLKVLHLISKISEELKVDLVFDDVLNNPVLKSLASKIDILQSAPVNRISKASAKEHYSLSPTQLGIWLTDQLEENNSSYSMPLSYLIKGALDKEVLKKSIAEVINRHESLRTVFTIVNEMPSMIIKPSLPEDTYFQEYSLTKASDPFNAARFCIEEDIQASFDLENGPLLRVKLFKLSEEKHILYTNFHHIIFDGWSIDIFNKELFLGYEDYKKTNSFPSYPVGLQLKDYTEKIKELSTDPSQVYLKEYWKNKFQGEIPQLNLPRDFKPDKISRSRGKTLLKKIDANFTTKVKQFAESFGVTPFTVLFATYNALLARYTRQNDIVVGVPVAGREYSSLHQTIGCFINTLPLRTKLDQEDDFQTLLTKVKHEITEGQKHQAYSFYELIDELSSEGKLEEFSLFNAFFGFKEETYLKVSKELSDISVDYLPIEVSASKYDLSFYIHESKNEYSIYAEYSLDLFLEERIERFLNYYTEFLKAVIEKPTQPIGTVNFINELETEKQITGLNESVREFENAEMTLHSIFETSCQENPHRIAIVDKNTEYTYENVNQKANAIASSLLEKGLSINEPVLLEMGRSVEMIASILGILKAGGCYVPLDFEYPEDRKKYIISDCKSKILISDRQHSGSFYSDLGVDVLYVKETIKKIVDPNFKSIVREADDHVYIMYTSGTTGNPKGVLLAHGQVLNTINAVEDLFPMDTNDKFLFKTNYTFDVSVSEIFGWVVCGAQLIVHPSGLEKDPMSVIESIKEHAITHINFVPSAFSVFLDVSMAGKEKELESIKYFLLCGEAVTPSLVQKIKRANLLKRSHNLYGPTEASIFATHFPLDSCTADGQVPIGIPISNFSIYILDKNGNIMPEGTYGELVIGGKGVAHGYLNRPKLNAERFVNFEWAEGRVYRTGDVARWLPNGVLEYAGRTDNQIKLRGYRIELKEIEEVLLKHPDVDQAVALFKKGGDDKLEDYISLFFTLKPEVTKELTNAEVTDFLANNLPSYMVPEFMMCMDEMPSNYNGKIDRKALDSLKLKRHESQSLYQEPTNEIEEELVEIWNTVLSTDKIGTADNFFKIGGNSLKMIKVISRVNDNFLTDIKINDFVKVPTVKNLSELINQNYEENAVLFNEAF